MFLKSFRIKSNTAIRGSDRRKLRNDVLLEFSNVTTELASEIIPNKDDMSVMKLITNCGKSVTTFFHCGTPIIFQVEKKYYPTVYLLWQYPNILPVFTTWPNVFKNLRGGADLMLPGIVESGENTEYLKGQICSVVLLGNRAPVAVAYTAVSSDQAREQGMRGKGVIILHSYQDQLWMHGTQNALPYIPSDKLQHSSSPLNDDFTNDEGGTEISRIEGDFTTDEGGTETSRIVEDFSTDEGGKETSRIAEDFTMDEGRTEISRIEENFTTDEGGTETSWNEEDSLACGVESSLTLNRDELILVEEDISDVRIDNDSSQVTNTIFNKHVDQYSSTDTMDILLENCFMFSLIRIKNIELPILTSSFYKNHLLLSCPRNQSLDIKKSSYKKLTKFLQVMEKKGLITTKEQSKGVHCIDSVHWENEELKAFKKKNSESIQESSQIAIERTSNEKFQPPEIEEAFSVSGCTRTLFQSLGYSKGSILSANEVRKVVTKYIKDQDLISSQNNRMVKLDPVLFNIVHKKGENNYDSLSWEEIFKRTFDRMNPCHIVKFNGQSPIIRKGKLQVIEIKLEQRMGNKKVTLVQNLEYFGIDPIKFSHKLQLKAASSASVTQLPGKLNHGTQVLIQGNQIGHVTKTLQDDYQIASKYINVFDKQSKNKRK